MSINKKQARIAVIIAVHNGAKWIQESILSCMDQELMPVELVVVDDGSTDGTAEVVKALDIPGLVFIRLEENVWMAEARNVGAAMTSAPLLLFWDADDVMRPDFLLRMAADLKPDAVASYCGRSFFSQDGRKARRPMAAPAYDRVKLWKQNYVPSPMLVRRHDWEAAGRWIEPPVRAMPDWHLALRLSRRGPLCASSAMARVRRHADNHMLSWAADGVHAQDVVRMDAVSLSVVCIYGGRLPGLMKRWMEAVINSLAVLGKRAELLILDGSNDGFPGMEPHEIWESITVRRMAGPSLVEAERMEVRFALSQYLAAATNDAMRMTTGDVVWFIEDDMLVPVNACASMLSAMMTDKEGPAAAVTGFYRSRRRPERFLAAKVLRDRVEHLTELPVDVVNVDITGTGCLMVMRDQAPRCQALWRGVAAAHDWCFTGSMTEAGKRVLAVPSVVVPHHTTEKEWV